MFCRLRFFAYVLIFIPSNVNIPNGFTNIYLITYRRSLLDMTRLVKVLIFQRKQTFNFLGNQHNFCLVNCWNFGKNRLATSLFSGQYGNSTNIDSFAISNKLGGKMYLSSCYCFLFCLCS